MAIVLRDVSDDDLPRACEIEGAAFAGDPLGPVLFPGPFPPDSGKERVSILKEMRKSDLSLKYMQAYDEETKQLIAFAKWHIYDTPELASTATRPTRNFGPGTNKAGCEAFFGGLSVRKREILGNKPHIYPAFWGRGAGGMLVEWGTKKADELGLPMYLESSEKGYRVYQRYGFRDVDTFTFECSPYGGTGVLRLPLMIREPVRS